MYRQVVGAAPMSSRAVSVTLSALAFSIALSCTAGGGDAGGEGSAAGGRADLGGSGGIGSGSGGSGGIGSGGGGGSGGVRSGGIAGVGGGGDRGRGGGAGNAVGATGGAGSPGLDAAAPGSAGDPYAAARQACVDKINALRAGEGKAAYLRWTDAEACTDLQGKSDSETRTDHGAFGMCKEAAQDECPHWPNDPNRIVTGCLQDMWNEGPGTFADHGHYINMSSTKYQRVACGFYLTPDKKLWAVQNFK